MAYQPLDINTSIDYVRNRPALKSILPPEGKLVAEEVGDGNLNLVFIIENQLNPEHSAVLKQALPYLHLRELQFHLRNRVRPNLLINHHPKPYEPTGSKQKRATLLGKPYTLEI